MLSRAVALRDQHILVVDDNPNNLMLVELILQEHEVKHIYKALSAVEAYDILEKNPIDAILLDVMMPDIDGIQACKTIRENSNYNAIPIIMVTANDDNDTFKESFLAGADDFIPKPINGVILLARLKSQLEKHKMHQTLINQSRFSAMDEIISMLAHQWRQPLGIINAITNTIRTKMALDTASKEDITLSFDKIESHLSDLSDMINSFKTSFGSNKSLSCTDISTTIDELISFNQEMITKRHINISLNIDKISNQKLSKQAIVQVLAHLMTNALEAFDDDHETQAHIIFTLSENNQGITLTIEDNGKGISDEDMPFIFDPYFSTKIEKNGKGLGLYFAKQLATQQLGGTLSITSDKTTKAILSFKNNNAC